MKLWIAFFIAVFLPVSVCAQYEENDWEERDTWMPLDTIIKAIGIEKGAYVADIGCHEGYMSVHLANRIGRSGKVFAVDVRMDRLETLKEIAKDRNLDNIKTIVGDYDNPNLPKGRLDTVIIMDTYHEIVDYMEVLKHVRKALKLGGQIVIIEKLKSRIKGKSRDEQTDAHSLSTAYVKRELKQAGFNVHYQNTNLGHWENDPEKVIWMLIATKG